jgi:hypothetical protein
MLLGALFDFAMIFFCRHHRAAAQQRDPVIQVSLCRSMVNLDYRSSPGNDVKKKTLTH